MPPVSRSGVPAPDVTRDAGPDSGPVRLRVEVTGAVQGVGFRPDVYRRATEAGLTGWVVNDLGGVRIEVEGPRDALERFLAGIQTMPPPRAVIADTRHAWLAPEGFTRFRIRASDRAGPLTASVLPDLATCPACLAEVLDPEDRRAGYPFTNCTDCGPRFSIIRDLPYDRPATTMAGFALCPDCSLEYVDPLDRRFHAQPNACPRCGPRLEWRPGGDGTGAAGAAPDVGRSDPPDTKPGQTAAATDSIAATAAALAAGRIVAVKGLGGFHLMCDARNETAVRTLRERKNRPTKPLAVMARDLDQVERLCRLSDVERELLGGPEAPIVLLRTRAGGPHDTGNEDPGGLGRAGAGDRAGSDPTTVAPSVAPGVPRLGVMLPYTPLHHLLLRATGFPLVATSGNRSEEPICISRAEALDRLGAIADDFLLHDRPIERPVDDSVVTVFAGRPLPLRRSRGYAPLPLSIEGVDLPPTLAVGAQQKNAVALARGSGAWLGPHVGDLDTRESQEAFARCIRDLLRLYRVTPEVIAHDLHPDYASTRWAELNLGGARRVGVQHHHAHLASVLAEHGRGLDGDPVLGVVWDGTGYGTDGTIWGGEFLLGTARAVERVGHLHPFRLPGGEAAVRDPRRIALALLAEAGLATDRAPVPVADRLLLERMIRRGIASPVTTSAGRLFDGVAAMLGLVTRVSFEGEAAMALEHAARPDARGALPFEIQEGANGPDARGRPLVLDWRPAIRALLRERDRGVDRAALARRFHTGLIQGMTEVARRVGASEVALSGGCFQNRILVEDGARVLASAGFDVLRHRRVPPNDGGLALGQVLVATAKTDSHDSRGA